MPHLVTGRKTTDVARGHYSMEIWDFRLGSFEPCE